MVNVILYVRSGILSVVRMGFDELRNDQLLLDEEVNGEEVASEDDFEASLIDELEVRHYEASLIEDPEVRPYPGQFDEATIRLSCHRLSRVNSGLLRGIFHGTDMMRSLTVTGDGGRIDAVALADCIEAAAAGDSSRLKNVRLEGGLVAGKNGDLSHLCKTMENHLKGVRSVHVGFHKIHGTGDVSELLDILFLSREFGSISCIELRCWQSPEVTWRSSTRCLEGLLERGGLLSLNLGEFKLSDEDILKMAECLPSRLASLEFNSQRYLDDPRKCGVAVAGFISASEHLHSFAMGAGKGVDGMDEFVIEVVDGIRRNCSISDCKLHLPHISASSNQALLEMVEGNCSMLNLEWVDYPGLALGEFLLELNSLGRSKVMGGTEEAKNAACEDWIEVMIKSGDGFLTEEDKTSAFYYYLTKNPPIVAYAAEHEQNVADSKKRQHMWPVSEKATKYARLDGL